MTVDYRLSGGSAPRYDEHLVVSADGHAKLWRTVATGRAGSFVGQLDADTLGRLAAAAERAAVAGPVGVPPRPGQPEEVVIVAPGDTAEIEPGQGLQAVVPERHPLDGPWGELLSILRPLVDGLMDQPLSAVELTLDPDGRRCTLRHLGPEPLDVTDEPFEVEVLAVDGAGSGTDRWTGTAAVATPAAGTVGWILEVPLDHAIEAPNRGFLSVTCRPSVLSAGYPKRLTIRSKWPVPAEAAAAPG